MARTGDLRKRENTRARLIDAGVEVFLAKGIAGARIDDVVKEAGFTRGAFYSNFSSMEELMQEVLRATAEEIYDQIEEAFDSIADPTDLDSIMEAVDQLRPMGRKIYVLSTEYNLYGMRNPDRETVELFELNPPTAFIGQQIERLLERAQRRTLIPVEILAELLAVIFMDSVAATDLCHGRRLFPGLLREVIGAVIQGLSVPIDCDDDAEPGEPGETEGGSALGVTVDRLGAQQLTQYLSNLADRRGH